jgi:hypothetical protein
MTHDRSDTERLSSTERTVAIGAPYCSIDMIEGSNLLSQRLAALPIQQVAKLHNTSVKMIERHYAKYIATALEDLARAAVASLVPRSEGNVVPMGKRA